MEGAAGPRKLSEGTMLDDKYRIERLLATGGMGAVYLGTHTKLRKRVAIKILNPQLTSTPMVERFHREAITASQIGHEGIAQVTDLGNSREGEPFLVMEYLEGESLAARLRANGPFTVEDACELGCSILSPLAAAHSAGIVHRDLKPDNVFLVRQSRGEMVKLLDFGISRAPGLESEFRLTSTGLVLGTPYYMSPEQARGETKITPAADLYAFGVILYEVLIGDVPIRAENYNQLMYRVTIGDFAQPRERRPELPEELERIILRAMAQAPEDRPASAAQLEQALLAFCRPVFREHASGRISTTGLSLLGNRSSDISIVHEMFAGPTMSDGHSHDSRLSPGDTVQTAAVDVIAEPDEYADHASQPALPTSMDPDDGDSLIVNPPARRPARRILTGIAVAVVGAAVAGSLVISVIGRNRPPITVRPTVTPIQAPAAPAPPADPLTSVSSQTPAAQPAARSGSLPKLPAGNPAVHEAATITLRFAIEPPGAAIMLDDARVNKAELAVPKDAAPHRLRITAAGYVEHNETISFDESQRLVVQLKRAAGAKRGKDHAGTEQSERIDRTDRTDRTDRIESNSPYR